MQGIAQVTYNMCMCAVPIVCHNAHSSTVAVIQKCRTGRYINEMPKCYAVATVYQNRNPDTHPVSSKRVVVC